MSATSGYSASCSSAVAGVQSILEEFQPWRGAVSKLLRPLRLLPDLSQSSPLCAGVQAVAGDPEEPWAWQRALARGHHRLWP